ncbi:MAG TPA: SOS response-associated peptidase family protein [Bacteroidales bacterium]|nr:SOS response-associated peptidase family protein [Bacteroidales bacterium]
MCLDISFKIAETEDSLFDYLPGLQIDPQIDLAFDINSHMQAHDRPKTRVIFCSTNGEPYLTLMRWGLLQQYMFRDVESFKMYGNNSYNTKAEKILDPKSSWYKIRRQRCLIDTPGIYEHRAIKGWKNKVPYFLQLTSGKRMLIPGFYNFISLDENAISRIKAINDKYMIEALNKIMNFETGELMGTYSMITRAANETMQQIHNDGPNKHRMPLFMHPEQAVRWIQPILTDTEIAEILNYELPSADLTATPVYTIRTKDARPDGNMKHERFDWPGLPPLGQDAPLLNTLF